MLDGTNSIERPAARWRHKRRMPRTVDSGRVENDKSRNNIGRGALIQGSAHIASLEPEFTTVGKAICEIGKRPVLNQSRSYIG